MASELKDALNRNQPNNESDKLAAVKVGDVLATCTRQVLNATVAGNRLVLPDNAKCIAILGAFVIAGGATGTAIPVNDVGTAPAANTCSPATNGDILFNAAEAPTAVDVLYLSPDGDVETFVDVPVVGSSATLPSGKRAWLLIEATITAGIQLQTLNGASVVARGSAPADNQIAMNLAGTAVAFNAADVVAGRATIKAVVARAQNLTQKLDQTTGY